MEWIDVTEKLPECWSQHRLDYASGYLLGCTKYGEIEITQLWKYYKDDGTSEYYWEGSDWEPGYITHWMPLPTPPENI
jgi:hypothetical protein